MMKRSHNISARKETHCCSWVKCRMH